MGQSRSTLTLQKKGRAPLCIEYAMDGAKLETIHWKRMLNGKFFR